MTKQSKQKFLEAVHEAAVRLREGGSGWRQTGVCCPAAGMMMILLSTNKDYHKKYHRKPKTPLRVSIQNPLGHFCAKHKLMTEPKCVYQTTISTYLLVCGLCSTGIFVVVYYGDLA